MMSPSTSTVASERLGYMGGYFLHMAIARMSGFRPSSIKDLMVMLNLGDAASRAKAE